MMLVPLVRMDDSDFSRVRDRLGWTDDQLIEYLVSTGWSLGANHDGNEFWPPDV